MLLTSIISVAVDYFCNLIGQFSTLNLMSDCTKFVCGRGSAPDPAGGAYDAPPNPLVGLVRALRALTSRASHIRLALRACMRTWNPLLPPPKLHLPLSS